MVEAGRILTKGLGFTPRRWRSAEELLGDLASELVAASGSPPEAVTGDPDDDLILACTVQAEVDVLLSGDRRHLLPLGIIGVRVITPQALLAQLRGAELSFTCPAPLLRVILAGRGHSADPEQGPIQPGAPSTPGFVEQRPPGQLAPTQLSQPRRRRSNRLQQQTMRAGRSAPPVLLLDSDLLGNFSPACDDGGDLGEDRLSTTALQTGYVADLTQVGDSRPDALAVLDIWWLSSQGLPGFQAQTRSWARANDQRAFAIHQECDVLYMVILIAGDDVEHHASELLLDDGRAEPEPADQLQQLLIAVGAGLVVADLLQRADGFMCSFLAAPGRSKRRVMKCLRPFSSRSRHSVISIPAALGHFRYAYSTAPQPWDR